MKKIYLLGLITSCILFLSCEKNELMTNEELPTIEKRQKNDCLLNLMLKASTDSSVVKGMNEEAITSVNAGLDESIYLEEIVSDYNIVRSECTRNVLKEFIINNLTNNTARAHEDVTMVVNGVEIYWPYCENWDGYSQPVIVINEYNDNQFIEADKVYAYKSTDNGVEKLIVDEEYAKVYPVWVINRSDVALEDIINLKSGNYAATRYMPRTNISNSSDVVCELNATRITSTIQHDTWINGGSEYIIYWLHPDFESPDSLRANISGQIKLSRKEISNGTPRDIAFTGNFDWSTNQRYNKLRIMEFDPGKNIPLTLDLKVDVNGVEITLATEITINDYDELIMEYDIPRHTMFTDQTQVDDTHYQKAFSNIGVTLQTMITLSNRVPEP